MKDVLVILGCIGGAWYLIKRLIFLVNHCVGFYYKWRDYKAAYYEKHNNDEEKQIGFKQREKIFKEKPLEKIKQEEKDEYTNWFEEYWESEPVDDEFIEEEQEEEYEDELDKYPLLKTRK